MAQPKQLTRRQIADLVAFVGEALLDRRARPEHLCKLMPKRLPSGGRVAVYEGCEGAGLSPVALFEVPTVRALARHLHP